MKFTNEEISLCKQIAGKHRKEINEGDWYININLGNISFLCQHGSVLDPNEAVPLWTISDCLEFLNKKRFAVENLHQPGWKNWSILVKHENVLHINDAKWTGKELEIRSSKTPLEACLKAVLAELEETK